MGVREKKELKVDPVLVYELADRPSAVWLARQLLATWLADRRVPQPMSDDLLLVCSELCTDALRYSEGPVKLRARRDDEDIVLEVDAVVARRPLTIDLDTPVACLDLVESVVDEVRVERRGRRTVTLARKRLAATTV
jgi:anti-sigma regulatory factor (Ser/Thr protein kinase)